MIVPLHKRNGYVYYASCKPDYLKVGFSISPIERIHSIRSFGYKPSDADLRTMHLVGFTKGKIIDEYELHAKLGKFRITGSLEWYRDTPETREQLSGLNLTIDHFLQNRIGRDGRAVNPINPKSSQYLSISEVGDRVCSDRDAIRWLVTCGYIPGIKVGGIQTWLVRESDLAICQSREYWLGMQKFPAEYPGDVASARFDNNGKRLLPPPCEIVASKGA